MTFHRVIRWWRFLSRREPWEQGWFPMWKTNLSSMKLWFALSPKSDQHQFSPNKISTWSREKVMGIDKMKTRGEMLWSFIILQGNVWRSMRRISVVDPGEASPPLFLDQTEAQRAEKKFFWDCPLPYLRVWMTTPPPLPEGLDLNLYVDMGTFKG